MKRILFNDITIVALLFFMCCALPLGCGTSSGTGSGGTGMTGGLGPSGLTCTTQGACFPTPQGLPGMSCPASVGASPAIVAADLEYVRTVLNNIRMNLGLPTFTRTAALDMFALNASMALAAGGPAHGYFDANPGTSNAENQTGPSWTPNATMTQIDEVIACFMSEEDDPAGFQKGHWEAIVCPCFQNIGVGLVKDAGGRLFMSIEFTP